MSTAVSDVGKFPLRENQWRESKLIFSPNSAFMRKPKSSRSFGKLLRDLRAKKGLNFREACERIRHVTPSHLQNMEAERIIPSEGLARRIAKAYRVNEEELVFLARRIPKKIEELRNGMPQIYAELEGHAKRLEQHYRDLQDIEFTIERGKLWILQTREGKRTARAAVQIAVDLVTEGLITREEAVRRVEPDHVT